MTPPSSSSPRFPPAAANFLAEQHKTAASCEAGSSDKKEPPLRGFLIEPTAESCLNHEALVDEVYGKQKRKSWGAVTKKKPAKKQLSLKKAVSNMKEKNFQGYDIERCTQVGVNRFVYIPKQYGKNSRKEFRNRQLPASYQICCKHCNLVPCSMLEYKADLPQVFAEKLYLLQEQDQSECLEAVRTRYRALLMQVFGKKFVHKFMPSNDTIPKCALDGTVKLVQEQINTADYESSLDNSPTTHKPQA